MMHGAGYQLFPRTGRTGNYHGKGAWAVLMQSVQQRARRRTAASPFQYDVRVVVGGVVVGVNSCFHWWIGWLFGRVIQRQFAPDTGVFRICSRDEVTNFSVK